MGQDGRSAAAALNDDLRPTRKKRNCETRKSHKKRKIKIGIRTWKGRWKKKHFESRRKKESNNNNNNNKDDDQTSEPATPEKSGECMCVREKEISLFFSSPISISLFFSLFRCHRIETERRRGFFPHFSVSIFPIISPRPSLLSDAPFIFLFLCLSFFLDSICFCVFSFY